MIEYLKKKKGAVLVALLLSVVGSAALAWAISAFMWIPFPSPWEKTEWSGFLGSYIGGIATLLAVVLTISYNNYERQEMENSTKSEELKRCALIVYYDFRFAFDEMKKLYRHYIDMKDSYPESSDRDILNIGREQITQVYLDSNWIQNVAVMRELRKYSHFEQIQDCEIAKIYRIYGNLATVERWITTSSKYGDNVLLAIESIVGKDLQIKQEICDLHEKIRKIADIPQL